MSTIAAPAPRRSGARRWIIRFVVAVIALNLITLVGARLLRSPGGPTSSSFATASDGLAAYAELLTRSGHPVSRLRSAPADARLDPRTTLVVLDPSAVLPADAAALRRFVAGGGRLVAGGSDPAWVRDLLTRPPLWSANAPADARPLAQAPETAGVRSAATAGAGSWSAARGTRPLIGELGGALLVTESLGRGRIDLLADASPLQNRLLAAADNPVLALNLAGPRGRPVVFVESVHGYGLKRGLAALPRRWGWALALLGLAALAWIASRIRRFGPPEEETRALPPARAEYVRAIAASLARTGDAGRAVEPVRLEARRRLARRAALPEDANNDALRSAARRAGFSEAECAALLEADGGEDAAIEAGRALAKLAEGGR